MELVFVSVCFIVEKFCCLDGFLFYYWWKGELCESVFFDDYGVMIGGLIVFYEVMGEEFWIDEVVWFVDFLMVKFYDGERGGFFYVVKEYDLFIVCVKDW